MILKIVQVHDMLMHNIHVIFINSLFQQNMGINIEHFQEEAQFYTKKYKISKNQTVMARNLKQYLLGNLKGSKCIILLNGNILQKQLHYSSKKITQLFENK